MAIPYAGTTLPGYLCRAEGAAPAPGVVFNSGRDVWAEDAKAVADEALRRGYPGLMQQLGKDDAAFDARIRAIMEQSDLARWGLDGYMWKHDWLDGVLAP